MTKPQHEGIKDRFTNEAMHQNLSRLHAAIRDAFGEAQMQGRDARKGSWHCELYNQTDSIKLSESKIEVHGPDNFEYSFPNLNEIKDTTVICVLMNENEEVTRINFTWSLEAPANTVGTEAPGVEEPKKAAVAQ